MADQNSLEFYIKDTGVWFPDEEDGWISGFLKSRTSEDAGVTTLVFEDERGQEIVVRHSGDASASELPPLKNPSMLEGIDDLINLSFLHEPAVLHNIKIRYSQKNIYTYSGIVLIAMNPFARMPIYGHEIVREYSGKMRGELEPHIFGIAEEAYRAMVRGDGPKRNQSIIISGESGAGKTVSAKYIMRYFATADGDTSRTSHVEEAVLATNPIMESFGNAKTLRNDNSSRFGKYIEIQFNEKSKIIGASIRTYLLERSRVVFQTERERNYHIFYQLCAGAPAAEQKANQEFLKFNVSNGSLNPSLNKELYLKSAENFSFLNQGKDITVDGVDDAADFESTRHALELVGISVIAQWRVFRLLAGILHLGNIEIEGDKKGGDSSISPSSESLAIASELLGFDKNELSRTTTKRTITMRSESLTKNLNVSQAITSRDSVAKFLYTSLFDWLVKKINASLRAQDEKGAYISPYSFAGILDIFGFEHFKVNSFNQLMINYCNEKIAQEFTKHVFKLEQEEYIAEGITWSYINYRDNQPCIELIEGKLGLIDLLDEESRIPTGSDDGLVGKYHKNFEKHAYFAKPRFSRTAFTIKHFACEVTYEVADFLLMNKDTVADEQLQLLEKSSSEFIRDLLKAEVASPPPSGKDTGRGAKAPGRQTLSSIFKGSLQQLMGTLNSTNCSYIRCIKPNESKKPFVFEPQMVLSQLRACGVLETVRISSLGFPSRWTFDDFAARYRMLVHSSKWTKQIRDMCAVILQHLITDTDKYRIGKTKIFFRAGQLAFVEQLRAERLRTAITSIQKIYRGYLRRKIYSAMRKAAVVIQTAVRGYQARCLADRLRKTKASIILQKHYRGKRARVLFRKTKEAIIGFQSHIRGALARKAFQHTRRVRASIKIQSVFRAFAQKKRYRRAIRAIVFSQVCLRRRLARRELLRLKTEARSVTHLKEVTFKLESKIYELTQLLVKKEDSDRKSQERVHLLEKEVQHWKEKLERLDREKSERGDALENNQNRLNNIIKELETVSQRERSQTNKVLELEIILRERDNEIAALKEELIRVKAESDRLVKEESSKIAKEKEVITQLLREEIAAMKEQNQMKANQMRIEVTSPMDDGDILSPRNRRTSLVAQKNAPISARFNKWKEGLHASSPREYTASLREDLPLTPAEMNAPLHIRTELQHPAPAQIQTHAGGALVANEGASPLSVLSATSPMKDIFGLKKVAGFGSKFGVVPASPLPRTNIYSADLDGPEADLLNMIVSYRIPIIVPEIKLDKAEILWAGRAVAILSFRLEAELRNDRLEDLIVNFSQFVSNRVETSEKDDDKTFAYWYANMAELLSVFTSQERPKFNQSQGSASNSPHTRRALGSQPRSSHVLHLISSLKDLLKDILRTWSDAVCGRMRALSVGAICEREELPGFAAEVKQMGFFGIRTGAKQPPSPGNVDQLIGICQAVLDAGHAYGVPKETVLYVIEAGMLETDVTAFNHLIMRRNFASWKRGMQIQYNCNRFEEFLSKLGFSSAKTLSHISQAAKLLQLPKNSTEHLDIMMEASFLLSFNQVHRLLSAYCPDEFEEPVNTGLLKAASDKAKEDEPLLLDPISPSETSPIILTPPPATEIPKSFPESLKGTVLDMVFNFE